jgi:hypothetical protein
MSGKVCLKPHTTLNIIKNENKPNNLTSVDYTDVLIAGISQATDEGSELSS